jgi:hypothetical protein
VQASALKLASEGGGEALAGESMHVTPQTLTWVGDARAPPTAVSELAAWLASGRACPNTGVFVPPGVGRRG